MQPRLQHIHLPDNPLHLAFDQIPALRDLPTTCLRSRYTKPSLQQAKSHGRRTSCLHDLSRRHIQLHRKQWNRMRNQSRRCHRAHTFQRRRLCQRGHDRLLLQYQSARRLIAMPCSIRSTAGHSILKKSREQRTKCMERRCIVVVSRKRRENRLRRGVMLVRRRMRRRGGGF